MAILTDTLLLWCLVQSVSAVNKDEYKVIAIEANWESAEKICQLSDRLLMSVLGTDILQAKISPLIQTEEVYWLNSISVEIMYSGQPVYLNFAYQSANLKLKSYLCGNSKSRETKKNISHVPMSWQEAKNVCGSSPNWSLYSVSSPKEAKGAVSLLKENMTFWVDKIPSKKIPSMVSEKLHMREDCVGMIKLQDGTFDYWRDNCTNKHKFVCVSPADHFAPTLTKMSEPFLFVYEALEESNKTFGANENSPGEGSEIVGSVVGGCFGGIIFIVIAGVVICYLYKRLQSRRDYHRSLRRYTQRKSSSKRVVVNTMSGSLPSNSCHSDDKVSLKIAEPDVYKDCEKQSYTQCQRDVVQDLMSRYTRCPSESGSDEHAKLPFKVHCQGGNVEKGKLYLVNATFPPKCVNELERLPAYHSMDGRKGLQVLEAYEMYDPDEGKLQQVHSYVNQQGQPLLSDLEQYDNIAQLPVKAGEKTALYEPEQYENYTPAELKIGGENVVSKLLPDSERMSVSSLDSLDKYENYGMPQRQKGLFQKYKENQARKASEEKRCKKSVQAETLDDLGTYERYEPTKNNISRLDELDAYENYAVKKY